MSGEINNSGEVIPEELLDAVAISLKDHEHFRNASDFAGKFGVSIDPRLMERQAVRNVAALYLKYPGLADEHPPEKVIAGCFSANRRGYTSEDAYRDAMTRLGKEEGKDYYFIPSHDILTLEPSNDVMVFSLAPEGLLLGL